jgi:L-aminopeptidase/D-esterase-like protein
MYVSKSNKKIKTNIKNIFISQVQYKTCGMTVVSSTKWLDFYIDKRGKNIFGMGTDMLYGSIATNTSCKAVCLVGSSTLGLEGICGVNQALLEDTDNKMNVPAIGAVCYSINLMNKDFSHPDLKLGKFAFNKRDKYLLTGEVGAGVNTRAAKLYKDYKKSMVTIGQGTFYLEKGKMKCFCITVLNSLGVIHKDGKLLHPFKVGKKDIKNIDDLPKTELFDTSVNAKEKPGNTTLTIFVTNIHYDEDQMKTLSKKLHDVVESMVYPYGTMLDGDIFFLVSSKEIKSNENYLNDYKKVIQEAIKSPFEGNNETVV